MLPNCELRPENEPHNSYNLPQDKIRYDIGYNLFEYKDLHWVGDIHEYTPWTHAGVRWQGGWLKQIANKHWITEMLLTDPPVMKALVQKESYVHPDEVFQRGQDCRLEDLDFVSSPGLDITHLRDFVSRKFHRKRNVYQIAGSSEWVPVPNGYNTTGWEMLCLLETEGEERGEMLREMELRAFPNEYPSSIYG